LLKPATESSFSSENLNLVISSKRSEPAMPSYAMDKTTSQPARQEINEINDNAFTPEERFYTEIRFNRILHLEEKRAERSKRHFLLLLLNVSSLIKSYPTTNFLKKLESNIVFCLRETDIIGWYENRAIVGIIFTEIAPIGENSVRKLTYKLREALRQILDPTVADQLNMSIYIYPEETVPGKDKGRPKIGSYPRIEKGKYDNKFALKIKRIIDIIGSLIGLAIFSPLFLVFGLAIKLTSEGPVLFKQERLGLYGKRFIFLKFRSMYANCDQTIHRNYIKGWINGRKSTPGSEREGEVVTYKMIDDHRITSFGRFLRKTSLDELPQFINVLKGEMSLVGPRPDMPYAYDLYDIWHRRRQLVKPGVTGLWQVKGRSSTDFDEMVRLDLKYIKTWSLWLDIKILIQTFRAVLSGKGAY
jgi:lipopolysaccharide/colanic/teichoic acid biosynthesis glycosyltransferase